MSTVNIKKEAAVALRDALSGLIETVKTAREQQPAAPTVSPELQKQAEEVTDLMVSRGLVSKVARDTTVENLTQGKALAYLKIAIDLVEKERTKNSKQASDSSSTPTPLGRPVRRSGAVEKTGAERLAEANRRFEERLGL